MALHESFIVDGINEFKKLPPAGKAAALGILGVVAYLGYRARRKSAQSSVPSMTSSPSDQTTAGQQSPFPMVGNLPLLPGNVQPIFDQGGQLIGYQQQPAPFPPSTIANPTPAPTPTPTPITKPTTTKTTMKTMQAIASPIHVQNQQIRKTPHQAAPTRLMPTKSTTPEGTPIYTVAGTSRKVF